MFKIKNKSNRTTSVTLVNSSCMYASGLQWKPICNHCNCGPWSQLTFACSKSTPETLAKIRKWNMFKVNYCFYSQLWTYFTTFYSVSITNFEQVIVIFDISQTQHHPGLNNIKWLSVTNFRAMGFPLLVTIQIFNQEFMTQNTYLVRPFFVEKQFMEGSFLLLAHILIEIEWLWCFSFICNQHQ